MTEIAGILMNVITLLIAAWLLFGLIVTIWAFRSIKEIGKGKHD